MIKTEEFQRLDQISEHLVTSHTLEANSMNVIRKYQGRKPANELWLPWDSELETEKADKTVGIIFKTLSFSSNNQKQG